jgi:signal transduction histidine kinase/CheY-like chemotaxis protein
MPAEPLDPRSGAAFERDLRFDLAVQRNRALVFALATAVALGYRALGLVAASWLEIVAVGCVAVGSALLLGWALRAGWHKHLRWLFDPLWLATDVALASWAVAATGGADSPWFPWYLASISAAAFVRGQLAAFLTFLASAVGYVLALVAVGDVTGPGRELFTALAMVTSLYAAAFFFLRGVTMLQEKRRVIERMRDEGRRKVDELTRLTAALEARSRDLGEANLRLREADRLKSQFLANVSHELRTPLNSIIGFSEILQTRLGAVLDERQTRFLGYVHGSGEQLLGIINDILDLSKIEAGQTELALERLSLRSLVDGVLTVLRSTAERRGIRVRVDAPADLPLLQADPARVKQVVYHLLTNAIKFSHPDSEVSVHLRQEGAGESPLGRNSVAIAVVDRGVGIDRRDRELVFEAFRQADGTASRDFQGAGLGLAIVKRFVELHAGEVAVDSAPGEGSTFTVHLPLAHPDRAVVEAAEPLATPGRAGGDRVLVVEDDPTAYDVIARHLGKGGYVPVRARTGDQAIALARRLRPVAVTLDLVLPGADGLAVLRQLRAEPVTREVPVIIISVLDNRELGLTLGADDYFVKPVDAGALLERLAELAPRRQRPPEASAAHG